MSGYARYGRGLATFLARLARDRMTAFLPGRRERFNAWRYVPDLLEGLGPGFIKMGQLASTRRDLLSEQARTALARLRENCQPLPELYVHAIVAGAGQPAGQSPRPLGFGSIAGVYLAHLSSGPPVAVKVRRPGVARRLQADAGNARRLGHAVGRLPWLRALPLREMVDFLATAAEMQVDLATEQRNLGELRKTLAHLGVRVPAPLPAAASADRLVMEYLPAFAATPGRGLDGVAARPADDGPPEPAADGTARAVKLLEATFTMIFRSGFVHLDLHEGNFAWDPDGTLNIVDAGFAVQLTPRTRRQFSEFFIGLSFGNGRRSADAILRSAVRLPPALNREAFTAEITEVIRAHRRLPARDFRVAAFTAELFAIQRRHNVFISSEFAAPVFALLTIEEQVREWAPDLDFQVVAQAIIISSIALIPCGV
ncbi:MAG TPA: AarF/UbiB family protein [Trebonia sp.]|nr:AarF/UbiB family protein [Trebonia sp.]